MNVCQSLLLSLLATSISSVIAFSKPISSRSNQILFTDYCDYPVNRGKLTSLNAKKGEISDDSRRSFFYKCAGVSAFSALPSMMFVPKSQAEEGDLTSQLFNSDGSLKEGSTVSTEATSRQISFAFPDSLGGEAIALPNVPIVYSDGQSSQQDLDFKSKRNVSYGTPTKWADDSTYTDTTVGINLPACNHILVYQTPTKASSDVIEKAAQTGVSKALQTQSSGNLNLKNADLIAGKKVDKDGVKYWEFDMAVAPLQCGGERKSEDLGLGFCPYDSIVLLSATVVNDRMYVFQLECDREQWKRSNADLKRVRSSFVVEA